MKEKMGNKSMGLSRKMRDLKGRIPIPSIRVKVELKRRIQRAGDEMEGERGKGKGRQVGERGREGTTWRAYWLDESCELLRSERGGEEVSRSEIIGSTSAPVTPRRTSHILLP